MDDPNTLRLRSGRRVCLARYGAASGAPVVFFQGTPSSRLMRPPDAISEALGARLLVVDRPGFGRSDPAPGRTLVAWAEDVAEVLEHFGVAGFHVAAVSGGCPYALATAWRWPDRVLSASVCGGSGPVDLPGALSGAALERRAGYLLARHVPSALRAILRRYPDPRVDAEAFVRRYTGHNPPADQAVIAEPDFHARYLANFVEAWRQGPDAFAEEVTLGASPWGFDLADIRVPVHFWFGGADNSTPLGMSRGMAARIPGARLTVLPGQGHMFVYGPRWREVLADLLGPRGSGP
ncbi:MAG: alpha/beta hydrolase [Polyangiales bacterium]